MLKLYSDTDIYIDEKNSRIILTRGYWNFNQINVEIQDSEEKERLIEIFTDLNQKREIDEELIKEDYKDNFMQLVQSGFLHKIEVEKPINSKILILTDIKEYVVEKVKKLDISNYFDVEDKNSFKEQVLECKTLSNIKQNPFVKQTLKKKLDDFIQDREYGVCVICLSKIDEDFCLIMNSLLEERQAIYCILDKDFAYIFGTKMEYTGCYECFSKRMFAKMKMNRINYPSISRAEVSLDNEYNLVMDFISTILLYNCKEFLLTNTIPISGRIAAVYTRTLEIRYENLLRLSSCPECGYIGKMENKERNLRLRNYLKEEVRYDED